MPSACIKVQLAALKARRLAHAKGESGSCVGLPNCPNCRAGVLVVCEGYKEEAATVVKDTKVGIRVEV